MNCTEYCSTDFDLPATQNANFPTKELVPDFGAVIDSIIDNEMRPLLDRYCREGDGFDLEALKNTTITTLYSCNVPFPKPKPIEGSWSRPDPYVPMRPASCVMGNNKYIEPFVDFFKTRIGNLATRQNGRS